MSDWQPIETAPRDGSQFLAWDGVCIENIKWRNGMWQTSWAHDEKYSMNGAPTHWMPLPQPPEDAR